jgi:amino acid transporter
MSPVDPTLRARLWRGLLPRDVAGHARRDGLAPDVFENISERFDTPVNAITITGGVLLVLIAFVPIEDIAKLASAFKILVFILINVAVIAFRQGSIEAYEPSFESPLYPLPQLVGIVGGIVLLR